MKKNKEILDQLGKIIINDVYDDGLKYFKELRDYKTKWETGKEFSDIFNKLNSEDRIVLYQYVEQTIKTTIFGILGIFEQNDNFNIMYKKNEKQINLIEISEMLKAELIIEGGWIERFSKEKTSENK